MKQTKRHCRRGGWLVATVALLIAFGGCLKFPLGDPETSKVDPSLVGVWFARGDDGEVVLWRVQAFDSRCYLAVNYTAKPDAAGGGWTRGGMLVCKAWVTQVKGQTFFNAQNLSEDSAKPYMLAKLVRAGETLTVKGVSVDFVDKRNPADAAAFAKLIEDNIDNPEMYSAEDLKYEKAGEADMETVNAILGLFN